MTQKRYPNGCLRDLKYIAHRDRDRALRQLQRTKSPGRRDYLKLALLQYDEAIRATRCEDAADAVSWGSFNLGRATGR